MSVLVAPFSSFNRCSFRLAAFCVFAMAVRMEVRVHKWYFMVRTIIIAIVIAQVAAVCCFCCLFHSILPLAISMQECWSTERKTDWFRVQTSVFALEGFNCFAMLAQWPGRLWVAHCSYVRLPQSRTRSTILAIECFVSAIRKQESCPLLCTAPSREARWAGHLSRHAAQAS